MMTEKENVPLNESLKNRLESTGTRKKVSSKAETVKPKSSRKESFLVQFLNSTLGRPDKFLAGILGIPNVGEYDTTDAKIAAKLVLDSVRVSSGIKAVDAEVQDGGLLMRSDCDLHVHIVNQEFLMDILFCYEEAWLVLGLETIMGESIPKNGFSVRKNIQTFVVEKMMSGRKKMNQQGVIRKAHKFALKKFHQLVLFLDSAREAMVLPHLCLFTKNAKCKSSKDVVVEFCKYFLQGEGDIIRHLGVLGIKLNFEQTFVHEFDYPVSSLPNDLRDGVRLARVIEILSGARGLSAALRVPAVSRLQKLHNVGICLAKVYTPTEDQPEAKCIVEGNLEKTVVFLTRIITMYDPETAGTRLLIVLFNV
jgi:abnormal spindle-like microcephaly-associated protein